MPTAKKTKDIPLDEFRRAWRTICEDWDRARGDRARTLAPLVRASLKDYQREALDVDDDLDSLVLLALATVLDHSKKGDALLCTAAKNLLIDRIRSANAQKRRPAEDEVVLHLDDPDEPPVVIADVFDDPLNVLLGKEAVLARLNGSTPKPLAAASLRLKKRRVTRQ